MNNVFSYVDLGLNYGYSKQILGEDEKNISISESTSGSWAWYLWEYTAIELNYTVINETLTDLHEQVVQLNESNKVIITETTNKIRTTVQGAGIRQALASRKAFLVPMISFGTAKQISQGTSFYKYRVNEETEEYEVENERDAIVVDSGFVSLMLRFTLTQNFGITLSGKTVFPAEDTSKAKNNISYQAGLSWVF
jgi:hypothetical protein